MVIGWLLVIKHMWLNLMMMMMMVVIVMVVIIIILLLILLLICLLCGLEEWVRVYGGL